MLPALLLQTCSIFYFLFPLGLVVHVDKRITLAAFKQNLEPYVGVTSTQFKVFRVYANNQEFESVRLSETLSSFSDDNKVSTYQKCLNRALFCVKQLNMFYCSIDNNTTRKSTEKGRIQSESVSAVSG